MTLGGSGSSVGGESAHRVAEDDVELADIGGQLGVEEFRQRRLLVALDENLRRLACAEPQRSGMREGGGGGGGWRRRVRAHSECTPPTRVAAGGESRGCALSGAILRTASSRMPPERTMSTPQMVSERGAASPAKLPHGVVTVFGVTQDSRARPSSARMFMSRSDAATYCAQVASPQQPAAS